MKRMMPLFGMMCLGISAMSQNASATFYGTTHTYYVKYHFSGEAWGQKVLGVFAHAGVQESYSSSGSPETLLWSDVTDVSMNTVTDMNYHGTAILHSVSGGGDGSYRKTLGPIVQYWSRLSDGSVRLTQENLIPVTKVFCLKGMNDEQLKAVESEIKRFMEEQFFSQTYAIEVQRGYCS